MSLGRVVFSCPKVKRGLAEVVGHPKIARKCGGPKPPAAEARMSRPHHACAPQASTRTGLRGCAGPAFPRSRSLRRGAPCGPKAGRSCGPPIPPRDRTLRPAVAQEGLLRASCPDRKKAASQGARVTPRTVRYKLIYNCLQAHAVQKVTDRVTAVRRGVN